MIVISRFRVGALAFAIAFAGTATAQDQPASAGTTAQPSTGSRIGGFFKQLGHSAERAASQIGGAAVQSVTHVAGVRTLPSGGGAIGGTATGNDGIHGDALQGGEYWNHLIFDPPEIDGYTHIRWGSSAQSRYNGEGTPGLSTCDPKYIGLAVLHLPPSALGAPLAFDVGGLNACLNDEKMLDPAATMETVIKRIAQLGATRKYYYRGQLHGILWNTPGGVRLTPSDKDVVVQLLGGLSSGMVQGFGTLNNHNFVNFNIVGPHWSWGEVIGGSYGGWPDPRRPVTMSMKGDSIYKLVIDIDHTKIVPTQLTSLSYVFFTVGTPRLIYEDTEHNKMYDLPVRIDKIVFVGNGFRSEYDEKEPMQPTTEGEKP